MPLIFQNKIVKVHMACPGVVSEIITPSWPPPRELSLSSRVQTRPFKSTVLQYVP